jgi:uncharacterized paraquat-inducible protein A
LAVDCTGTEVALCSRCQTPLVHSVARSLDVALACAFSALVARLADNITADLTASGQLCF